MKEELRYDENTKKVVTQDEYVKQYLNKEEDSVEKFKGLPIAIIGFDSEAETLKHIKRVNDLLLMMSKKLIDRASAHDASKLKTQEKELFDMYTPRLKDVKFNDDNEEYNEQKKDLEPALKHHYQNNRHHPEYHKDGVNDMTLIDLVEMLVDWKATNERQPDGNVLNSIDTLKETFKLTKQLADILKNTVKDYLQ